MLDAINPLLDSGLINEDVSRELNEAWESKLTEAKEMVRAELREEFAQRYEHDKAVMVEALDRMVTEGLATEVQQVQAEKRALAEDRVKFTSKMNESATKFNNFLITKLAEELGELRSDRKMHTEGMQKLENFVVHSLAREITEFAADKRDLVETKVKLVSEARSKLTALQTRFVKESAAKLSERVGRHLKTELTQLHEDIKVARENNFGRRIFEAYAAEFGATHLNENAEVRKLHDLVEHKDAQLAEAIKIARQAKTLVESKDREIRIVKEGNERSQLMSDLLAPLNKEKQDTMRELLESVQTARLKNAFEKYLPAVLAEGRQAKSRQVIAESVSEVTGDKTARSPEVDRSNVIDIKRLAGL